jgi:heme A synthase
VKILAGATTALAFLLLIAGSLVHQTGSSLACPDWPLCNGTAFPTMRGGILFEHSHRLIALALVAMIGLLVVRSRRVADRGVRAAAIGCAVLVAVQALLGATTVLLRLPPIVSVAHLATAMTLLGTLAWIAGRFFRRSSAMHWIAAPLVLAQCVLGALVRHHGAALACFGFPACSGTFFPEAPLGRLQMVHRAVGLVVVVVLVVLAVRSRAWLPAALSLAQIGLGVAVVLGPSLLEEARFELVTLHHAIGAAIALAIGFGLGRGRASHDAGHDRELTGALRNQREAKLDAT